jgi:hypothetical protein
VTLTLTLAGRDTDSRARGPRPAPAAGKAVGEALPTALTYSHTVSNHIFSPRLLCQCLRLKGFWLSVLVDQLYTTTCLKTGGVKNSVTP